MNKQIQLLILLILTTTISVAQTTINLSGKWKFQQDDQDLGIAEKWFTKKLQDAVVLPGSMMQNNKGNPVTLQTKFTGSIYDSSWYFNPRFEKYRQPNNLHFPFWLTPNKYYVGAAWYQKEIIIPASFSQQQTRLFLERCHTETMVWVDEQYIGTQASLVAPHEYLLPTTISPGKHTITIRVDNRIKEVNVGPDSHSITDHTQGNWNGIVGKIQLITTPNTFIKNVQIFPDIERKIAVVKVIKQGKDAANLSINTVLKGDKNVQIPTIRLAVDAFSKDTIITTVALGNKMKLWSEFTPNMYELTAQLTLKNGNQSTLKTSFGMRSFKTKGQQFSINNQTTFLRGTVENCVFPLTGYAPMNVNDWKRIFRICKSYGLNHMRFHSYCPPEAAFEAADELGFYLQPEGPSWANHGSSIGDGKPIDQYIYDETIRMEERYGNHPSYCMLAYGNEPKGSKQVEYLTKFIHFWQKRDTRRLYTGASVAMSWPLVPENEFMVKSGARNLSWNAMPESNSDYTKAIEKFPMPYLAHEMGQWCAFPNFKEIKKYTGVYKAKNFELFQQDLSDQGMLHLSDKLLMATGKLQTLCYKYEIEKSLRTPNNGGFQLLSLNDYSGQGTALVGVLDAFWDEKGYTNATQFSQFCNATVPLIRTSKFVYASNETAKIGLELFHYGANNISNAIFDWQLTNKQQIIIQKGSCKAANIVTGKNTFIDSILLHFNNLKQAEELTFTVKLQSTNIQNNWQFWVFPASLPAISENNIYYASEYNKSVDSVLSKGGAVYLNLAGKINKGKEIVQHFLPVFWNTSWFKMRPPHTLGILVNEQHPVFSNFPTSYHSNIQWWNILNRKQVMHLEEFPTNFTPLIQPIDTWFLNRRLAMLFEAKVGKGKIMVSSVDFATEQNKDIATKQLWYSIQQYMLSKNFNPTQEINAQYIKNLVEKTSVYVFDAYTKDSPDELKPKLNITAPK